MVISPSLPRKGDPKSPNFVGTKGSEIQAFCWRIVCMSTPRFRRRLVRRFQQLECRNMMVRRFRDDWELWGNKDLERMIVLESFEKKLLHFRCESLRNTHNVDVFIDCFFFFSGLLLIAWESNNFFSNSYYLADFMKSSNKNISPNISSSTFFYISSILGGRSFEESMAQCPLLTCSLAHLPYCVSDGHIIQRSSLILLKSISTNEISLFWKIKDDYIHIS